jgi:uncharacterized Zn finger protein
MPSLPLYQELRGYARQLGRWDELRADLRSFLDNQQTGDLLIQVFLEEGEVDRALDAVRRGLGYGGRSLEVARAAEETRPEAALEIYRPAVERLITGQGRENYRQAVRLLLRMRALYQRLGQTEESDHYLADLRERFRRLRALKEELAAVGL